MSLIFQSRGNIFIITVFSIWCSLVHSASPHANLAHCYRTMGEYEQYISSFIHTVSQTNPRVAWGALLIPTDGVLAFREGHITSGAYFTNDPRWVNVTVFFRFSASLLPRKFIESCVNKSSRLFSINEIDALHPLREYEHHHLAFYPSASGGSAPERILQYDTDLRADFSGVNIQSIEDTIDYRYQNQDGSYQQIMMRCWYFAEDEIEEAARPSQPNLKENIPVLMKGKVQAPTGSTLGTPL